MGNIGGPSLIDDGILCVAYVIGQVTCPCAVGDLEFGPLPRTLSVRQPVAKIFNSDSRPICFRPSASTACDVEYLEIY